MVDIHATIKDVVVVAAGFVETFPSHIQSPAVKETLVTFVAVLLVSATALPTKTVDEIYSPTFPAVAFPPFVTPTIPGVVIVGDVARTGPPEPVALLARPVATPVPRPLTPVEMGNPVAFVSVPLEGVPSAPPFTTKAPAVPVFTPRAVRTPVPVVVVAGATPAPPPMTREFATNAAELAQVLAPLK